MFPLKDYAAFFILNPDWNHRLIISKAYSSLKIFFSKATTSISSKSTSINLENSMNNPNNLSFNRSWIIPTYS